MLDVSETGSRHAGRLVGARRRAGVGWLWWLCLAGGASIHVLTAALRLGSLFPPSRLVDYASYYAAAWTMRLDASPYRWPPDLLAYLAEEQQLLVTPPPLNSPPPWPWLLRPLTHLPYPASSIVWLAILLAVVAICHVLLVRLAGCSGWRVTLATLPVTLTFGPSFLNLTLGQSGVFLLLAALLGGRALARRSPRSDLLFSASWTAAVAAKLFPLLWIGALLPMRRWRQLIGAVALCFACFGTVALLAPGATLDYWTHVLPGQAAGYAAAVSIDDQSLAGFLGRLGRSGAYVVPGLDVDTRHEVVWHLPWELPAELVGWMTAVIVGALLAWLWRCWRRGGRPADGPWCALVLFSLLPFPHMERYNHVLALPAMAWLWGRGLPYRRVAIAAYAVLGLSRLNHLWALMLPSPWGPLATGLGLFGVLVLLVAVGHAMADRAQPGMP